MKKKIKRCELFCLEILFFVINKNQIKKIITHLILLECQIHTIRQNKDFF